MSGTTSQLLPDALLTPGALDRIKRFVARNCPNVTVTTVGRNIVLKGPRDQVMVTADEW